MFKTILNRKYTVMLPLLLIGLAIIFSSGFQSVSADQSQIYVNTAGNDNYNGESQVFISGVIGPKKTIKNATGTVIADGTVHIASGTYNENNITINQNMNIIGESKFNTIINGNNIGRIFGVSGSTYSVRTVLFSNLKLINGNATGGGAISNTGPNNVNIENCIFEDNTGSLTAGAVYSYGEYSFSNPGYLTITNCNFINNKAISTGSGGAIFNAFSNLYVTGCDFVNNSGTGVAPKGGAISNSAASGTVQFNRFIGNTATVGNAIYNDGLLGSFDASYNWWGTNSDPSAMVSGPVTVGPWMVLTSNATPETIVTGATSTVTANLLYDSGILDDPSNPDFYYHDPVYGHVPDGILVNFASDALGTVNPLIASMVDGSASTTFTAGLNTGTSVITSTLDTATANANVLINSAVPPVVTSTNPVNNAVNVALNKVIQITFDKNIQFGTNPWIEFVISGTGTVVPFTSSILGNVLSITPDSLLAAGTKFIVVLHSNSVTDLQGSGLAAPYTTKFTTTTPPVVTSTNPVNNAVNVALNKVIQITFNKNIQLGTNPWIEFVISGTGTVVPFTSSILGNVLSITPDSLLAAGTKFIVVLHSNSITDLQGNGLAAPYTTKFTTTTPPVVTSTNPVNNAVNVALNKVIQITFNKNIQLGTNPWIEFVTSSTGTPKAFTTTITGNILNITPTTPLAKGTKYIVVIHSNAVTDTTGTAGLAAPYTTKFTTTTV